ncbi:MAG TPA: dipeptidase PepE [Bacteroidales bacterium]|nr:dipeptidase PepE [Bacteroidales bacterium]HNR42265.1 dipeptidase PepE [Bacteroidales bacterium]HPM17443.1 dipeptidase PepE [Bacteroidales bacterium]
MRLLLISNSTNAGEPYLDYPKHRIRDFLGRAPVRALFVPYAAVTFSYDDYEKKVQERFREIGHDVISIHHWSDPVRALADAPAIVVGGGNTWMLLKLLRQNGLILPVRKKVLSGTPYIGWSAGSNVACPTIQTTNDMPITRPSSFRSFNLVPFQINPHYLDASPEGHAGETREQRIAEFIEANPDVWVVGLREGTMLHVVDNRINLTGPGKARIFRKDTIPAELGEPDDLSFLLR